MYFPRFDSERLLLTYDFFSVLKISHFFKKLPLKSVWMLKSLVFSFEAKLALLFVASLGVTLSHLWFTYSYKTLLKYSEPNQFLRLQSMNFFSGVLGFFGLKTTTAESRRTQRFSKIFNGVQMRRLWFLINKFTVSHLAEDVNAVLTFIRCRNGLHLRVSEKNHLVAQDWSK